MPKSAYKDAILTLQGIIRYLSADLRLIIKSEQLGDNPWTVLWRSGLHNVKLKIPGYMRKRTEKYPH